MRTTEREENELINNCNICGEIHENDIVCPREEEIRNDWNELEDMEKRKGRKVNRGTEGTEISRLEMALDRAENYRRLEAILVFIAIGIFTFPSYYIGKFLSNQICSSDFSISLLSIVIGLSIMIPLVLCNFRYNLISRLYQHIFEKDKEE